MRILTFTALVLAPTMAFGQAAVPPPDFGPGIRASDGRDSPPPSCPQSGSVVARGPLPSLEYGGSSPDDPSLCLVRVGGHDLRMYFGVWERDWPGAAAAREALGKVIRGPTGTVVEFDTRMAPGAQWHDVLRNDGIEDLKVAGEVRPSLKISHYREGFGGNTYRSVTTGWKDLRTGMLVYVTYRHISGRPEAGTAWDASSIHEAP